MSASRLPTPRVISTRAGIGSAGQIIQPIACSPHRVTLEHATLVLIEAGEKRIRWQGGERTAGPGDALTLQAGQFVGMTNTPPPTGDFRAQWISFGPGALEFRPGGGPSPAVALHPRLEPQFRAAFERAFEALNGAGGLPAAIVASRMQEVLLWLSERGFHFNPEGSGSIGEQVRRILATNPAAEWSMETVAQQAACSVATLRRRLAAEGVGFRDLLQDVRMCHALTLLQNTADPVLSIAFAVGYKSASRFTSRFQARFGFLPSDIRGQLRGRGAGRLASAVAAE